MKIVDVHEAKTHLSRLIEEAAGGSPFIIAKTGRPLVKVVAVDAPATPRRLGFMRGEIHMGEDFDRIADDEVRELFEGGEIFPPLEPGPR